ncbi:thioredoxin family protein [Candidatus Micrarchaeota archaeon]|nr:thioredoxin family protein [Candidatus Micrarchaeota archaeon]
MRPISWKTYAAAFLISAFLFGFGILAGIFITQGVNMQLDADISRLQGHTSELEVLLLFNPDAYGNQSQGGQNQSQTRALCPFYKSTLASFDQETTDFGVKLDALEGTRGRLDPYVLNLKREYTLKQLRDYLLVQKTDALCGTHTSTLLYFYTNNNCPTCTQQGKLGPELKQKHPSLMIYAFDTDLAMPVVNAFKTFYGITAYPSLVLDGKTMSGFQSLETIDSKLTG